MKSVIKEAFVRPLGFDHDIRSYGVVMEEGFDHRIRSCGVVIKEGF